MAWLPGEQGGDAIVDALTGATSPGGKLPISYPRSSGQIPIFYAHKVSGGRSHWKGTYVDESNEPLYPFGHGLSYCRFSIEPERRPAVGRRVDDIVEVTAVVTNTGERRGDEVVQLYGRDPVASITRPVRELIGFARVTLAPGESVAGHVPRPRRRARVLPAANLSYVVEPGEFEFFVGASATDTVLAGTVAIVGDAPVATVRASVTNTSVSPVDPSAAGSLMAQPETGHDDRVLRHRSAAVRQQLVLSRLRGRLGYASLLLTFNTSEMPSAIMNDERLVPIEPGFRPMAVG